MLEAKTNDYLNPAWSEIMKDNGLATFEQLWAVTDQGWFEPPNRRRGGWSGVVRKTIRMPDSNQSALFVKLQENHVYRSWRNLFRPVATFQREYHNLADCISHGVPTLELVYFGQRIVNGDARAILVTRELTGFNPLSDRESIPFEKMGHSGRKQLFASTAHAIRLLHYQHYQHNCLYPKHVFVRKSADGGFEARLIDFEKAKKRRSLASIQLRDLGTMHRHAEGWSRSDRLRFLLAYLEKSKLDAETKRLIRRVLSIVARKKNHR